VILTAMNTPVRVTKIFTFDTAHALLNYDGPCKNIHGHTYRLSVTLKGIPNQETGHVKNGMVIDFTDLKKIVQQEIIQDWDHALLLNETSSMKSAFHTGFEKVIFLSFQPTCENLLIEIKNRLCLRLEQPEYHLHSIRLEETPTSYAEWHRSDET
jgi:6-pyruvoyltetrahydropterin/6-carboxytetrahydropterin synthase